MAHVFEGAPDGRQAGDIKPGRFRPQYRVLTDEEKALHDAIKAKAAEMEALFERARELRYPPMEIVAVDVQADGLVVEMPLGDVGIASVVTGTAWIGPDYFGDGMRSLELAVMWTVKGLTA